MTKKAMEQIDWATIKSSDYMSPEELYDELDNGGRAIEEFLVKMEEILATLKKHYIENNEL
jgi:hypothetical protein